MMREDNPSPLRGNLPLPRGERVGVRGKPQHGFTLPAFGRPLTLTLSPLGRGNWAAFWGGLAALLLASSAQAHAVIKESRPAEGATVAGPDVDVLVRFNSRIDHARSRLSVATGKAEPNVVPIAPDSPADALAGKATGLAPGAYRLLWQVLSVDGHITRGEVRFRVQGAQQSKMP